MTEHPQFVRDRASQLFADLWALEGWEKSKQQVIEMISKAMNDVASDARLKAADDWRD